MAKSWIEVAGSESFKQLPPEQQDGARRQYFDDVVAPKVPAEQRDVAWGQFSTDVGVGRRELPAGVQPSTAGGGRGSVNPGMSLADAKPSRAQRIAEMSDATDPSSPNYMPVTENAQAALRLSGRGDMDTKRTITPGRVTDKDIPDMTAGSVARDVAAGVMQIVPTALKGAGDLTRLATGDRAGKGLSDFAENTNKAVQQRIGSERGQLQRQRFEQDMADPALNAADVIVGNPGALADQVLPTVGSMALPVGAASAAGKLAQASKAAQLAKVIDEGTVLARANRAREAAAIGATVAQNAADTYSTVRDKGGDQGQSYLAAALTAPATYVAGRLTGGAAEAQAAKILSGAGGSAGRAATAIPKAMLKEGGQEMGEDAGQIVGETTGLGQEFDAGAAGKRMAVAGTLGAVVGGGVDASGQVSQFAQERERVKRLKAAGETDVADMLERRVNLQEAEANTDSELQALVKVAPQHAEHPAFQQAYKAQRIDGVKPAEAAARAAIITGFGELAAQAGLSQKATDAALDAAKTMPMAKLPGFLERYVGTLASKGMGQAPEAGSISGPLSTVGDTAMTAAVDSLYGNEVRSTMAAIEDLESQQNQSQAPATPAPAATETIAPVQPAADLAGQPIDEAWTAFTPESGTLNVPRAYMPQIKSAHRGAMVNFLKARGIEAEQGEVPADMLKPTQAEFSPEKVTRAQGFDGADRSILVSSDGYVLDGHHQWLAKREAGENVKVIRLDAPIAELLPTVKEFPSASQEDGAIQEDINVQNTPVQPPGSTEAQAQAQAQTAPAQAGAPEGSQPEGPAAAGADTGAPALETPRVILGRNNVPMSEGGKAFKTRLAADEARKLQPMMRVIRSDGGYALTEKTPAQLAAQDKAARRLRNPQTSPAGQPIPAHAMIAAAGGLAPAERADMGMEGNFTIGNRKLFAGEGKGLTIERVTEKLIEDGYLPEGAGHDQARALIKRSLTQPQYTAEGFERMADAETQARFDAAMTPEEAIDDAVAQIEALSDNQLEALLDADIPWDAPSNTDTVAAMKALGFTDQEIQDATANQSGKPQDDRSGRGEPDEGATSQAQADPAGRDEAPGPAEEVNAAGTDDGPTGSATDRGAAPDQRSVPSESSDARPVPPAFPSTLRADGTLAVTGDPKDIREALKDIPAKSLAGMKGGILVGRTQADKAVAILRGEKPKLTAREAAEAGQAAREAEKKAKAAAARAKPAAGGLTVGIMPGNAEPVIVKDGVVFIGKAEALDFDSGEPVRVKVGASDSEIVNALKVAGALSRRQRVFGLVDEKPNLQGNRVDETADLQEQGLTSPTPADVLAQQQRAADGAKAEAKAATESENKAKADAERNEFTLTGSDRAADVGAAGGQQGMFEAEERVGSAKPEPIRQIEDAGEKIGGARKDRWKDRGLDLNDLDSMSESEGAELATKANVWKPDYEAMAEATEPVTAAMVKTVYDQLAAQPKKNTPEGRRNYVTMMQAVRKAYLEAKSPEDVKQAGAKLKSEIGIYSQDAETKKQAREVLFSVYKGRSDPFVLSYNELSKAKKLVDEGFPAKGEPWKKRLSLRVYSANGFTSRGLEITLQESAELGTPLTSEQVAAGFYRINTKDGKAVGYAPTKADAEAAAKTIYERDLKKGASDKAEPTRPNLDALKRENLPKRIDRDVSADDFVGDFGFRGVEFGNWAAQDERQRIINMAYDGLMDLAEIMGVPPKAMSLNGTMGMAFGARGGGKFAAHYEPGKLVINMTKINGGGSMAHEWAHALDHYFGELNQKDAYTTKARGASGWYDEQQYKGVPRTRMEKDAEGKWANVTKMRLDNMRPEMAKAFDDVMSALFSGQETKAQMVRSEELAIERYQALADKETDPETKAMYLRGIESRQQALEELRKDPDDKTYPKGRSQYASQAQALSGKSANGYWTRPTEMFARAFESWVFDKVTGMGARSDYLVHGVEEDRFAGGNYKGNPYPTGEERATINAAFDKLAATIQTKKTDKGVAMFARQGFDADAFSRMFSPPSAMAVSDVQKVVDQLTSKWKSGPTIKVVATPEDLPIDAPADARGLIHNGTAYIVARNHVNRDGVAKTLGHEAIGHYGLWRMLGDEGMKRFNRNLQLAMRSGNAQLVFGKGTGKLVKLSDRIRETYVDKDGKYTLSAAEESSEIAAFAVENAIDPATGEFKPGFGFVKEVYAKVAEFLRSLGIDIKFTNAELHGMLVSAMRGLEAGHKLDGGGQVMVAAARTGEEGAEFNALDAISRTDELFALPKSDKTTIEGIAADNAPGITVKKMNYPGLVTTYALTMPDGAKANIMVRKVNPYGEPQAYGMENREDGEFEATTDRPGRNPENVPEDTEDVYIDVSNLKEGGQGRLVYNIAATFAHNTDRILIGDPAGLSNAAMRRRTEHMLSSALKFGTTRHLAPHPRQTTGAPAIGVPALRWTYGDDLGNIRSLINVSTKSLENAGGNPFTFEPTTGTFRDSEGAAIDGDGISLAATLGSGKPGKAGRATLQRGAVLSALLRQQGKEGSGAGQRNGLLGDLLEWGREHSVATNGIFYARGTDRVDQTETPAFKAWFKTSKVVDAAGKPLVVYHGTAADITTFSESKLGTNTGAGSASMGFFFAGQPEVADSYARQADKRGTIGDPRREKMAAREAASTRAQQEVLDKEVADGRGTGPYAESIRETLASFRGDFDFRYGSAGRNILPVYLQLQNPLVVDQKGKGYRENTYADVITKAKQDGHDGVIFNNTYDGGRVPGLLERLALKAVGKTARVDDIYVVFRPEQIKSAIGNNGDFDGSNPNIAFARGTGNLFQPNIWSMPEATRVDRVIYELQDGKVDLKRAQEAIKASGQAITEQYDARLAETLYPGRVAYRSATFLDVEAKPLLEAMARNKVGMDELADYLHARGAEERNAQIAKVNPAMPDGGAGTNTKGELMTNQAARDYLAAVSPARKVVLDAMAKRVDTITAGTRALLVAEGLEKQETIDAWEGAYKNYVPMFRDEAETGMPPHPQGAGFQVKGSASKRATGSTKEVTNILAHVLMQREAAITRAEKNRVALALYGQALSHPNPDFWTTIKPSMKAAEIAAELVAMGVDPMTAQVGMEGVPTIRSVNPLTGKVQDMPNPIYRNLPGAIPLKVNGADRVLMINVKSERGQRLATSLKNLDGLTQLDIAGNIIGKSTRWLAAVNTQYNPAFGLVNLTRDTLGGAINLGSTELRGNALKVLAQTPMAILGIARELASGGQTGKWQSLYRQFQADGGQTGFKENFRDPNDRAKAVEKELASLGRAKLSPGRATHAILDLLDGFNTTLENAVRLSAYSAALDKGISRAEAARLGRELTVDFNRKGRAGREVGPLYAFFNASVQGGARTIETLRGPTGVKVIAGGIGLGILQALMLAAAGYDDDEIPEFVKTRALIIPLFGREKKYISIPYPLGLHVLPNTGRVLAELTLNGGKDIGKRSVAAIGEIAGAFNPLGGGNIFTADGALKTVAPTTIDPLIEIGFNRNFAGGTIEKTGFGGEPDNRPGVARAKESTQRATTGQAYMGISKAINTLTGGTDYEAGMLSPTPERVRYIAQTVGGGVLREFEKTINSSTAAVRGEKVKMSGIPVAGRFYGEVDDDQAQTSRYFNSARTMRKIESSVKAATKAGDLEAADKIEDRNPEATLIRTFNRTQRAISALNKEAVQTIGDREEMVQIDKDRAQLMREFNEDLAELERESGKVTLADRLRTATRPKMAENKP